MTKEQLEVLNTLVSGKIALSFNVDEFQTLHIVTKFAEFLIDEVGIVFVESKETHGLSIFLEIARIGQIIDDVLEGMKWLKN